MMYMIGFNIGIQPAMGGLYPGMYNGVHLSMMVPLYPGVGGPSPEVFGLQMGVVSSTMISGFGSYSGELHQGRAMR